MSYGKSRKHDRIESEPEEPIIVLFKQPELKELSRRIEVKDVSLEGLGLKVPLGSKVLKQERVIKDFELMLPGAVKCVFSGKVVYKRLSHCGIEFINIDPAERWKLEIFIAGKRQEQKRNSEDSG
jgi:c-di-GMP-binding flagellar brake protein YcgR